MKLTIPHFAREQWGKIPPVVKKDLSGKTVVVIGANTGLGFEAAQHFATMNPGRLVLGCRSRTKGEVAVANTAYSKAELWIIDLSTFSSVSEFANAFEKDEGRLDVLVMNAGVNTSTYKSTGDGWENSMQVNNLSTSLLVLRLLPTILRTAREHSTIPRIVIVASDVHYWASIEEQVAASPNILQTLSSKEYCTPKVLATRYFLTKLLNVFFVRSLNDHLKSLPITVNAVNPGYCYSELRRELSGVRRIADGLMECIFALPAEVGGRQLVWAALGGQELEEDLRGSYVSFFKVSESSDFVLEHPELQERLWNETIDILAKVDTRVRGISNEYLK